ncbi:MAG: ABC transporter permease [Acidobacteriota bacterium]
MKWNMSLRQALRALSMHKLRTFFMMLGIVIGIATLSLILSLGEQTRDQIMERFKKMVGTMDTVVLRPGAGAARGMPTMTDVEPTLLMEDAEAMAREIPLVRRVSPVQNASGVEAKVGNLNTTTAVFGVTSVWMELRNESVERGSFFSEDEVGHLARVTVIGQDVAGELFPGEDPLGKTISLNNVNFQVKGILKSRGAGPGGGSLDNLVLIPLSTFSRRLYNQDHLTMVIAQLEDPADSDRAMKEIRALLRERHGIVSPAEDDFTLTSPRASMERMARLATRFNTLLALVAAVSLLVGGVVIMNLMLTSVSERQREIGLRRSVGAKKRDITLQFLLESLVVTLLGGAVGTGLAIGGFYVLTRLVNLPPLFSWQALGLSFLSCVAIGIVFGIQPARRAATLDPIRALRE